MYYKLLVYQKTPIDNLIDYLRVNGFVVIKATEENIAEKIEARDYDICLIDGLTNGDRYLLIHKIRTLSKNVALIFMTDDLVTNDAINCFNAGADDYIHTPHDIRELMCRMRAVLNRSGKSSYGEEHTIGNYTFNPKTRMLSINGEETKLTGKECKLLLMLSEYRNAILPRNVALKAIWFDANVFNGRSMDVYITKLRKHLSKDPKISITSIRSQGFVLVIE